jgi:peroxiredoxin
MRKLLSLVFCATLAVQGQGLSGRRAPSFSLPDSALSQHDILDYRGSWLLIDFMQTTCAHCKLLTKSLEEIKARYGKRIAILSIVIPPDNMQTVGKYIVDNAVTTPILFDSSQVAASYFKATPAHPSFDTPHLFAIDPNGMIVRDWTQAGVETGSLQKEIDQLVNGKK